MKTQNQKYSNEFFKQKIEEEFLKRINFRFNKQTDLMNLRTIFRLDWCNLKWWKCLPVAIDDRKLMELDEDLLIKNFVDVLENQMYAPTTKTKFGKWLVAIICKRL